MSYNIKRRLETSPEDIFELTLRMSLERNLDPLAAYLLLCINEAQGTERRAPTLGEFYELNIKPLFEYFNIDPPSIEEVEKKADILEEKGLISKDFKKSYYFRQ